MVPAAQRADEAVVLWRRHRLAPIFCGAILLVGIGGMRLAGSDGWFEPIVVGGALALLAAAATSQYRVVALTDVGLYLLTAGRFRQVATGVVAELAVPPPVSRLGGTLVSGEWEVCSDRYVVGRRGDLSLQAIVATALRDDRQQDRERDE